MVGRFCSRLCAVLLMLLLALLVGCGAQPAQAGDTDAAAVTPVMLSTEDKQLRGSPLGEQELAFSFETNCKKVTLRVERLVNGKQASSAQAEVAVDGEGTLYVLPHADGNVVFFQCEGKPTKQGDGLTRAVTTISVPVDNVEMSSGFHTALPQRDLTAASGETLWLAAVSTDKAVTTQMYEPYVYADESKRDGYEELLLFTCVFE